MAHTVAAGSPFGAFLEGGLSGFERGTEIRGRRRDRTRLEEDAEARRVGDALALERQGTIDEQNAARAERERVRFEIELGEQGFTRIPGEPSAPGPFAADESGVVQRFRGDVGAGLAGPPAPAGFFRSGPSLAQRKEMDVAELRSLAADFIADPEGFDVTSGRNFEALSLFNLEDDALRLGIADTGVDRPFQYRLDSEGRAFNYSSVTGTLSAATLEGTGEQFIGRTSGGATPEAFVRRAEAVMADAKKVADEALRRPGEEVNYDPIYDEALQRAMGVSLDQVRRVQAEFYRDLLGTSDAPDPEVGVRHTTVDEFLRANIGPGGDLEALKARIGQQLAGGSSDIGLGNRGLAASEVPRDTVPAPPVLAERDVISPDKADFLRRVEGMTDEEINRRYIVR